MADAATPPNPDPPAPNPPAPEPRPAPNPPAPPRPEPRPEPKPEPQSATLTLEQVESLIADREAKWEADRLPKLREQVRNEITVPLEADGLIRSLRQELQAAGKYFPKDDDASDPDHPGDIAALDPADHATVLRTNKDGTKFTKLHREINRLRTRLVAERKAAKGSVDALGQPQPETPPDVFENIRKQKHDEQAQEAERRKRGLERVFSPR